MRFNNFRNSFIHSTNDLKVEDDKAIRELCRSKNIKLTTIGLTELAFRINKNKYILKEIFSIDEQNRSILSLDEFIEDNSVNPSSNMSYSFVGREKEVNEIITALTNNRFVFVSGDSGCGKSRLVVEALERINKRVFCINKLYAKAINNLLDGLDEYEEAIVFADDINQLDYVGEIRDALNIKRYSKIKLVGTVRNYALQSIVSLFEDDKYQLVQIGAMSDDEIKEVLKANLKIKHQLVLDRIIEIANGNIRIAILAGEESLTSGVKSLYNSESLLSTYYKRRIAERFGDNYSNYVKVLFLVSFVGKIDLENLARHKAFLDFVDIDEDGIKQKCHNLERLEIFRIISNRVVGVDDQCLSNYVVYDSFIASKIVSLASFVKCLFKEYGSQIVDSLNMIGRLYTSQESFEFVKSEIVGIWDYFKEQGGAIYDDFVSKFAALNKEESICYCKQMLFDSGKYTRIVGFKEFDKAIYGGNPYISILESIESPTSIHYLFKALNYDTIRNNAYAALERILTIETDDFTQSFSRFSPILKEIKSTSDSLFFNLLILSASKILDFNFSYTSYNKKNQFTHYSFSLKDENNAIAPLRHQLWELALLLSDDEKYKFVATYFSYYPSKETKEIFRDDLADAEKVLNSINNRQSLRDIDICLRSNKHLKRTGLTWSPFKSKYTKEISFLTNVFRLRKDKYEYEDEEYSKSLNHYINNCAKKSFEKDIKLLASFKEIDSSRSYKIYDFLAIVINKLDEERIIPFVETIFSYDSLANHQVLAIAANRIIDLKDNHFETLENVKCNCKNELWLYYFEKRVEKQMVDSNLKDKFKVFVGDRIKEDINCFDGLRPNVVWALLNGKDIVDLIAFIFEHTKRDKKVLPWTLELMFNPYSDPKRADIFKTFIECNRLDVLFDIFVYGLSHSNDPYGASEYTFTFAGLNIEYLRKIARLEAKTEHHHECYTFKGLWKQANCKEYAFIIFDEFVKGQKYLFFGAHYLKHILDLDGLSDNYPSSFIETAKDLYKLYSKNDKAQDLVKALVNETNDTIKIDFLVFLINNGLTVKELSKYNFFTSVESFSDSYVPVLISKIAFFEKLRDEIDKNPELIEYSRCVSSIINDYLKYKEEVKIKEVVDGMF